MNAKHSKWLITALMSAVLITGFTAAEARDDRDANRHYNRQRPTNYHANHSGYNHNYAQASHDNNGRGYQHNGYHYNYYHNGNYYHYYNNGGYYNYYHNGAYYNYYNNGGYYMNCNVVAGYFANGFWVAARTACW